MDDEFHALVKEASKLSAENFASMIEFSQQMQMDPIEYMTFLRVLTAHHLGATMDFYLDQEGVEGSYALQRLVDLRIAAKEQRDCQNSAHNLH